MMKVVLRGSDECSEFNTFTRSHPSLRTPAPLLTYWHLSTHIYTLNMVSPQQKITRTSNKCLVCHAESTWRRHGSRGENIFQHWIFLSSQWWLFAQNIILFLPLFLVSCLFTMFIKYFPGLTPPGCYVHLHSGPGEISPGSSTTECQRLIIFIGGAGLWSRSVLLGPLLSWPDTSGVTQVTGHHWSHPHTSFSPA